MNKSLENLCDALEDLSTALVNGWSSDSTLSENWGNWTFPNLNRHELAAIPLNISDNIRALNIDVIDESLEAKITNAIKKLIITKIN